MKTTPPKQKVSRQRAAQRTLTSAGPADPQLIEDLVAANHILADHGVLDGYGHVSARHDRAPDRYLLSRSLAPALVTADDIMEYDLDSNPVDAQKRALYVERFIHGEIYKARPEVQAVVHHHSPAVIPFGVSTVPLRPLYHMAAFLWEGVPVFEIRDVGGMTDILVRSPALGRALAQTLDSKAAALMRGHGAVVVSSSLSGVVGRSIYLQLNAYLQAQAIALGGPVTYLDPEEGRKADLVGYQRAWELWKRKAMAQVREGEKKPRRLARRR
jgi:HCOMODA/2-hydroxy-3-carboxy-muconic semialdehyde decarboxylase